MKNVFHFHYLNTKHTLLHEHQTKTGPGLKLHQHQVYIKVKILYQVNKCNVYRVTFDHSWICLQERKKCEKEG